MTGVDISPEEIERICSDMDSNPTARQAAVKRTKPKPTIVIAPGHLPEAVDEADQVLLDNTARLQIFDRGGEVVRIQSLDQNRKRDGLDRKAGSVQLAPLTVPGLQDILDREIVFERQVDEGDNVIINCPSAVSVRFLARHEHALRYLTGIIEAPILRPDGSILTAAGYDDKTGLFLRSSIDWSGFHEPRGAADAEAAIHVLREPFAEFPFVACDSDFSVLIACVLTALQRRLLESAPFFGFTAPAQRSGKSMLAESVGMIAIGRKPAAACVSSQGDEFRKMVSSALREGHSIINLDNLTQPLGSPDLARAITQPVVMDRLLGATATLHLPTNVLWTGTGNNLSFRNDMPSRSLLCSIDPRVERPEERTFTIGDLPGHLREHRKSLVIAALTILRAYEIAGRPLQNVRPWGGFTQWSQTIREPLIWLGLPDPCKTRERIVVNDPDREMIGEVLEAWHELLGEREILVHDLIAKLGDSSAEKLRQAVLMIAASPKTPGEVDARRLGKWCSEVEARIVDGYRLERGRKIKRAVGWRVSLVSLESTKHGDQNGGYKNTELFDRLLVQPAQNDAELNSPNSPKSSDSNDDNGVDV